MPTGACGIDCDVCRLNLLGICTSCGSGRSEEGFNKIAAQQRILGSPCPILACAMDNRVEYCPRDCKKFPCNRFKDGPYPFSQGFLSMQERRRKEGPPLRSPSGADIEVPVQYWDDLIERDLEKVCKNAAAKNYPPDGILLPFLKEFILIDIRKRCLRRQIHGGWDRVDNPLLELLCLVYLLRAGPQSPEGEMIGVDGLKASHFFKGPHELKVRPLVDRYGNNLAGFKRSSEDMGGEVIDMADASYMFMAFPKVPLYYLLWEGDKEFQPRLSILFDRSIERHLTADSIWGLVNLISDILLIGDKWYGR